MEFKHPCCRCGFCCVAQTCIIGMAKYGVGKNDNCPGLTFDGDLASCALAPHIVPVDDGCCISARAVKDGVTYDYASLPGSMKQQVVRSLR